MPEQLSASQARRIALAAQGFTDPRPTGKIDRRHLRRAMARMGLVQIDSVNVLTRSRELPFFSRLGAYPREALTRWLWGSGEVFEFVGHEASLLPVELHPLMRWRMSEGHRWSGMRVFQEQHAEMFERLEREVAERGPVTAAELDAGNIPGEKWWAWSTGKMVLEALFSAGRIAATRVGQFERAYALPEVLIPPAVLELAPPDPVDAQKGLILRGAKAHGVGTALDLIDYFRLHKPTGRRLVKELAADGALHEVQVEGWREPGYMHPDANLPRWVRGQALLSPFDPVIWERSRVERVFDFRYRIEIYTPEPKRVHGYYVLPFLLGDRLVARVDLKADRKAGRLLARATHGEAGIDEEEVATTLLAELRTMAAWLDLDDVLVSDRGDLAPALLQECGS